MNKEQFPTEWGFSMNFPEGSPLGHLELINRLLIGEGHDLPDIFSRDAHDWLEKSRYLYQLDTPDAYIEANLSSTFSAIISILNESLPEGGRVLEIGAGMGAFTQNTTIPVVIKKGGSVITTEISHKPLPFGSILDRSTVVSGVDARNLPFLDGSMAAVVANSTLDVLPPLHLQKAAEEMSRVLEPSGVAVHILDIGPGVGWARNPNEQVRQVYTEALSNIGVHMNGVINLKKAKKFERQIGKENMFGAIKKYYPDYFSTSKKTSELAAAICVAQDVFHSIWMDCIQDLGEQGIDKSVIPWVDFRQEILDMFYDSESPNFISNIYSLASDLDLSRGKTEYKLPIEFITITLLDLMQRSLTENITNEDNYLLNERLEQGIYINEDIFRRSQPDIDVFDSIQIIFSRLSHIYSKAVITDSFQRAGLEIIGSGVRFGESVDVEGGVESYASLAGVKLLVESEKPTVKSLVHYIVARKL